ncbi:hypothetical protein B0J18DRAFT_488532 [Chaetomium sp. MPI-SDFR-AT-0129]|nr:hypothetical protein B0J18DRAFT_488532 [Chaetomium sp. MPI-SDFR-AT-0129]
MRPKLPSRKSSGTMIVPRDSTVVGPVDLHVGPDDVRAMSPRRTSEDIQTLGKETREELRKHAKALQDSLHTLVSRIEAVKIEHDRLDHHNKFLQKSLDQPLPQRAAISLQLLEACKLVVLELEPSKVLRAGSSSHPPPPHVPRLHAGGQPTRTDTTRHV